MSATVCLEIPREVLHSTRMTLDELRQELALHLFQVEPLLAVLRAQAGFRISDDLYERVLHDEGETEANSGQVGQGGSLF